MVEGLTPARATNDGRVSMRASVKRKAREAREAREGTCGGGREGGRARPCDVVDQQCARSAAVVGARDGAE